MIKKWASIYVLLFSIFLSLPGAISSAQAAAPDIVLSSVQFTDTVINPGDTVTLVVGLQALNQNILNVSARISTTNSCVTFSLSKDNASYQNILVNQTADNSSAPFEFTVSPSCPPGEQIDFDLAVIGSSGFSKNLTFSAVVGKTPLDISAWASTSFSNLNPMYFVRIMDRVPLVSGAVAAQEVKAEYDRRNDPSKKFVIHLWHEIDDILGTWHFVTPPNQALANMNINSAKVQAKKAWFKEFFETLAAANVKFDELDIDQEEGFSTWNLLNSGQDWCSEFAAVMIPDLINRYSSMMPQSVLQHQLPTTELPDHSNNPYCWKSSQNYQTFVDWNHWAAKLLQDVYQEAITGPLRTYYDAVMNPDPLDKKVIVRQYEDMFSPIIPTVPGNSPAYPNYLLDSGGWQWNLDTQLGDTSSMDLYYMLFGNKYKNLTNPNAPLPKRNVAWYAFIDLINKTRSSLRVNDTHLVMPWLGYPGMEETDYWFWDQMYQHLIKSGISKFIYFNPYDHNQTVTQDDQHASDAFALNNASYPQTLLPIIPYNADSITTGNFTTTYVDFLNHLTGMFTITTSSSPSAGGNVIRSSPAPYEAYTDLTLTAQPNSGYQFIGWSDGNTGQLLSGTPAPTSLTFRIDGNRNRVANFATSLIAPTIIVQPQSQIFTPPQLVRFTVEASGTPPFNYQWKKNGENLSGATSSTLTLSPTQAIDAGTYSVVVRNFAGSVTSNGAVLTKGSQGGGPTQYVLTVNASHGTVDLSPPGGSYDVDQDVVLTPTAADGYVFSSWSGDIAGATENSLNHALTVSMDANKTITANFTMRMMDVYAIADSQCAGGGFCSNMINKLGGVSRNPAHISTYSQIKSGLLAMPVGKRMFYMKNENIELYPNTNNLGLSGLSTNLGLWQVYPGNTALNSMRDYWTTLWNQLDADAVPIDVVAFDQEVFFEMNFIINYMGGTSHACSTIPGIMKNLYDLYHNYPDGTPWMPTSITQYNNDTYTNPVTHVTTPYPFASFDCSYTVTTGPRYVQAQLDWDDFAHKIMKDVYDSAIIGPMKAINRYKNVPVSNYQDIQLKATDYDVTPPWNDGPLVPFLNYNTQPAVPSHELGNSTSPQMNLGVPALLIYYQINSSGTPNWPLTFVPGYSTSKNSHWRGFIYNLNRIRAGMAVQDTNLVMPWIPYVGQLTDNASSIDYWYWDEMYDHLAQNGVASSILYHNGGFAGDQHASDKIAVTPVMEPKINLPQIDVDADEIVTGNKRTTYAQFMSHWTLFRTMTATVNPPGAGTIVLTHTNPSANDCSQILTNCPTPPQYYDSTWAKLIATANPGYVFSGWTGAHTDSNTTTTRFMDANYSLTANFTAAAGSVAPNITIQPTNQSVAVGAGVTFSVTASGTPTPSYQWRKGTGASIVDIPGATSNKYTINPTTGSDANTYRVYISNSAGNVTSNAVTLTVNVPVSITTQPVSQTIVAGQSATFTVAATGSPLPAYQWKKNGSVITGATSASYTITSASSTDAASYTVDVTNTVNTVTSTAATLTVNSPPSITAQPVSLSVIQGASATFSVTATGTPTLTYQWKKGGSPISGATASTLTINPTSTTDAGSYTVDITNLVTTVTSNPAILTVNVPPSITSQPSDLTVLAGASASFSVVAAGTTPLSYQWKKNGNAISGAIASTYSITTVVAADAGTYTVTVNNVTNLPVTSTAATLTVNGPPSITTQPTNLSVTQGAAANFSVTATGTAPLTYQWQKDGVDILGATNSSYSIPSTTSSDAGNYRVIVNNITGVPATSSIATLTVNVPPSITTQPSDLTVVAGASASFSVVAAGTTPLSYQWKKNGNAIGGATGSSYSIASTVAADAGTYTVTVNNVTNVPVTSSSAVLTVNGPPSILTQPSDQIATVGNSATFSVSATGTAPLTYQWQKKVGGVFTDVSGETNASYTISSVQTTDAGIYQVIINNVTGVPATSNPVTLTVDVVPTTTDPAPQTVVAGQSATFSVTATGSPTPTYQWKKGTTNITSATNASYTIASTVVGDEADYSVVVTNRAGTATSAAAHLTVRVPPTITSQPSNQIVVVGNPATFSVTATGRGTLTYQWQKNNVDIAGATNASYTTPVTVAGDTGSSFRVIVNDDSALPATSNAATLTVDVSPTTTDPAPQTVVAGQSATFSVTATGSPTPAYQWKKGTTSIPLATNASYTIASTVVGDEADYSVVVTNRAGSVTSASAHLTVRVPPTITAQPANQIVVEGDTATFNVTATGRGTLTYQWQKDNVDIAGATSSSYTTPVTVAGDSGSTFRVIVNDDSALPATSNAATLTVDVPPSISSQPIDQTIVGGHAVTFSVTAAGSPTPTYQWKKGATDIPLATNASYTIPSVVVADEGDYSVVVTNRVRSLSSSVAHLTVHVPPTITTQPSNQVVVVGATATFNVTATGRGTLTYQWQKDNVDIAGATASSYNTPATVAGDSGSAFRVIVNDDTALPTTSTAATLTVDVLPATTDPVPQTVVAGQSATFSVTATGSPAPTYQWKKGTTNIPSATNASHTIPSTVAGDEADYSVVVTNRAGSVTSAAAHLTVHVPPTIDSQPINQTVNLGQTATFNVTATGRGTLTYQWQKNNVDIAGATTNTYTTPATVESDRGSTFKVVVTDNAYPGLVSTSTSATLIVIIPPSITNNPVASLSVVQGQSASFTVEATGTAPNYQWQKNGGNITGANAASYSIPVVSSSDAGDYSVVVSNPAGTVTSTATTLTVTHSLTINASHGRVIRVPDQASYAATDQVALVAVPDSGYDFSSWSGDASGDTIPVMVTMDSNKTVTANFVAIAQRSANQAPVVNAGPTQTVTLQDTVTLAATATDDGLPEPAALTTSWTSVVAPGQVTFDNPHALSTIAHFSALGTYVLSVAVSDGALTSTSSVVINVNAEAGAQPTTYSLSISSSNGSVTKTPNQSTYTVGSRVTLTAQANPGYKFVSWGGDATGTTSTVNITMDANKTAIANFVSLNQAPVVSAGPIQTITLPAVAYLKGSANDDGLPAPSTLTHHWTMISGPGNVTFQNETALNTTASFSAAGNYVLQLASSDGAAEGSSLVTVNVNPGASYTLNIVSANGTVTRTPAQDSYSAESVVSLTAIANSGYEFTGWSGDASGMSRSIKVTMNDNKEIIANFALKGKKKSTNKPPVVSAGSDLSITLSQGVNLAGKVTDDGLPSDPVQLTTLWSVLQGPGTVSFINPNAVNTTATFSKPGVYVLQLTANDGKLESKATVRVTVSDLNVHLTVNAANGTVSRSPNQPTYHPGDVVTLNATPAAGYQFAYWGGDDSSSVNPLTVTVDSDKNLTAYFIPVESNDDHQAPVVNAGDDQTVTLPLKAILKGTATKNGEELKPSNVIWCKLVGPGNVSYANSHSLITTATFSKPGDYVLLLTVIDANNNSGIDRITIHVQ